MNHALVVYDTETASLKQGVIEFAAVTYHNQEVYETRLLGNPGCPIDPYAAKVHGYYDSDVKDLPAMDGLLKTWWQDLKETIGEDTEIILCGHNTSFDYRMCKPHIPLPDNLQLCTLTASRQLWPEAPNHKLSTMISFLKLNEDREFHTALDDVKATIDLLQCIQKATGKHYLDIAQEQSVPKVLDKVSFGKYKGKRFSTLPMDYLQYMLTLDLDKHVKHTMTQELARRG